MIRTRNDRATLKPIVTMQTAARPRLLPCLSVDLIRRNKLRGVYAV